MSIWLLILNGTCLAADETTPASGSLVTSASEIDYPPFCMVDDNGTAGGFSVELLQASLKAMGRNVTFRTGTWEEVRGWLENGQVQALPLVGRTPEREAIFDFTFPYMSLHGAIVVRNETIDIHTLNDLAGRTVAVMKGDNAEEFVIRSKINLNLITTPTFEDALNSLSQGQCDAVVIQRLVALRLIRKITPNNLRVINEPVQGFRQDFCFAVRDGDSKTLSLLNEGLALVMADGTFDQLHAKWFAALELPAGRRMILGGNQNYPPYEYLDEHGRPAGYNVDLTRAIARELGLDIEIRLGPWSEIRESLRRGEIDAVQGMYYSVERDLTFDFTPPHLVNNYVSVVRRGDIDPPATLTDLKGKQLVVEDGDIISDLAIKNNLQDHLSLVENQGQALVELAQGRHDCALVSRLTAFYWIKKKGLKNLVVGRHPLLSAKYCYAVPQGHKALLVQLSEGLKEVHETGEYQRIYEKWMGSYEEQPPGFLSIIRFGSVILIPLVLLLLGVLLWSWSLRKQVAIHTGELQNREEQYRLLADNMLDVIWTMNLNLEFTYVNQASYDLVGLSPEEVIGTRLSDHCDKENYIKMLAAVQEALSNGSTRMVTDHVFFEADLLDKNGKPVPVEIHGKVNFDENHQPVSLQGVTRDISQRKKAEEGLRRSEALLNATQNLSKIGGWEWDVDRQEMFWTTQTFLIHGFPSDSSASEQAEYIRNSIRCYEKEDRPKIMTAFQRCIEKGEPYELECPITTQKGQRGWIRVSAKPAYEDDRIVKVIGSIQDITDRVADRMRIEHLNRVLRAIRDVNHLIEQEKEPEALVREGCRLLVDNRGYISAMIILTDEKSVPGFWVQAGMDDAVEKLEAHLETGRLPGCCESALPDGRPYVVKDKNSVCSACPMGDFYPDMDKLCVQLVHDQRSFGYLLVSMEPGLSSEDEEQNLFAEIAGDIAYALNVMHLESARNVSEEKRKTLEGQLAQALKMESVGRLAGGVAHDYNNMLSVIIGYTELAMDKAGADPSLRGDLKEILKAAKHSTDITRQLLAFARQQTIAPKILDLNDTVASMLKMLRPLIGEDIDLAWHPGHNLWQVNIDPSQVDQILANLSVNARDAIAGIGKITIETTNVTFDEAYCEAHSGLMPGEYVMLGVGDNGCGIDPSIIDAVFEPFFTTKGLGQGTGLGLSTVYGIVKQNNGFINVYSEPKKGTVFKIYLPRHTGQISEAYAEKAGQPVPRGDETILLVEDESSILDLGKRILEGLGYTVVVANTPGQALTAAKHFPNRIDLLITDVVMPEMNGRDLSNAVKAIFPDIITLYMSGYTSNVIAHQGVLEEGVNFIQKPFSKRDLAIRVRSILDKPA